MAREQHPSYRAYSVLKREGQDDFWLPIGAAFPHQDGKGYNIVLQALPVDARVILREVQDEERDQPSADGGSNVTPVRSYKDRRADPRDRR